MPCGSPIWRKRPAAKAPAVTAELEPPCVYPLIQGSDLSPVEVRSRAWLLCPHTAETKIYPLAEADLRQDLPLTYAYLTRFRDLLETRKGFAGWERPSKSVTSMRCCGWDPIRFPATR